MKCVQTKPRRHCRLTMKCVQPNALRTPNKRNHPFTEEVLNSLNNSNNQNNFDNDNNKEQGTDRARKKPSVGTYAVLTCLLLVLTALCVAVNYASRVSDDAVLLLGAMLTDFFAYVVIAGIMAFIARFSPRAAFLADVLFFIAVVSFWPSDSVAIARIYIVGLPVFLPFVVGTVLGCCSRSPASSRVRALIPTSIAAFVGIALTAAMFLFIKYRILRAFGTDISNFSEFIEYCKLELSSLLDQYLGTVSELYGVDVSSIDISGSVNAFFNALPGTIGSLCVTLSIMAQLIKLALGKMTGLYDSFDITETFYNVSIVSAVLYGVCALVSLLWTGNDSVLLTTLECVASILCPVLALSGIISLLPRRHGRVVRVGCFPITAVAFLLTVSPPAAVLLLSFIGVFDVIKTERLMHSDRSGF